MRYRGRCVVVKRIGGHQTIAVVEFHVIVEHRLPRFRVILTPVRHQVIFAINQLASINEEGCLVKPVIGQAIREESLPPVLQHHVATCHHQLLTTVVSCLITGQ